MLERNRGLWHLFGLHMEFKLPRNNDPRVVEIMSLDFVAKQWNRKEECMYVSVHIFVGVYVSVYA